VPPAPRAIRHGKAAQKLFFTAATALLVAAVGPAVASARPFSPTSPLNTPIRSNPAIHPGSSKMIDLLSTAAASGGFRVSLRQWTVPVYTAARNTPRVSVRLTADWAPRRVMLRVPIPARAQPDPQGDGHMAIYDPARGCEFDFWQAVKGSHGWSATWGNRIKNTSSGIFRRGLSARASGFALRAGVILPSEIRRGRIRHALVFAYPYTREGGPVLPATQSDGNDTMAGALPMGARLQLRPGFNLRALHLPRWQLTIARALKRYGMYLGDSGGTVALRAVSAQSYVKNPYLGPLRASPTVELPLALISNMRVLNFRRSHVRPRLLSSSCAVMR
jgi:hypothetical protein